MNITSKFIQPAAPTGTIQLNLTLSIREALALRALCRAIGGNSIVTARGIFDRIGEHLDAIQSLPRVGSGSRIIEGEIVFAPYSEWSQ